MCLLALQYRTFAAAPVLLAANRDEYFNRPATLPAAQGSSPRVVCGVDSRAHGTWLGVNEHGLVVAVTNRLKSGVSATPRSRGLLCRELLNCASAADATLFAASELDTGRYAGANFLCVDEQSGSVVQATDELLVRPLSPGLHLVSNADLDDHADPRQVLARSLFAMRFPNSPAAFLTRAAEILSYGPSSGGPNLIVLRGEDRGTVSSMLLAITKHRADSVLKYADGPPDRTQYQDLSFALGEIFASVSSDAPG